MGKRKKKKGKAAQSKDKDGKKEKKMDDMRSHMLRIIERVCSGSSPKQEGEVDERSKGILQTYWG